MKGSGGEAKALGLVRPDRVVERHHGGGRMRDHVRPTTVTVAGQTFRDVPATIKDADSATDANIGVRQLRSFVIVTDFPGRAVWLHSR